MSGAVMLVMALLPGIPMLPFLALGGGAGALAFIIDKRTKHAAATEAKKADAEAKTAEAAEEPIAAALKMDDLKIELGYALLPLVNSPDGTDRLTEQIKALRRSLAIEMGFVMPAVRILDNVQLDANAYVIKIKEVEAGTGKRLARPVHGHGPGRRPGEPARHAHHRADLRPAGDLDRRRAQGRGLGARATPWSTPPPCCRRISPSCSRATWRSCCPTARCRSCSRNCRRSRPSCIKDIVPSLITISGIQRVLQILLAERVSIRDLATILEGIADGLAGTRNPVTLAEHVRARLARQICAQHTSAGRLPAADRAVGQMGAGLRRSPSSARATSASSPCSRRKLHRIHHAGARDASRRRRARARRRCWSPRPASGRSCAASSSASARRRRCCRRPKSTRGRG